MNNRLKAKIKRKYWQRIRVCKVLLIVNAYSAYHLMQSHTTAASNTLSYVEAEKVSSVMNELFNAQSTAKDFLFDKDEQCDKAIDSYNTLKKILDGCSEVLKDSVLTFCKSVYDDGTIPRLKVEGFIFYPSYLSALLGYVDGFISFLQLRHAIAKVRLWDKALQLVDSSEFREDFLRIEELFDRITNEKKKV